MMHRSSEWCNLENVNRMENVSELHCNNQSKSSFKFDLIELSER